MGLQSEFNTKREYKKKRRSSDLSSRSARRKKQTSANSSSIHKQMTLMNRFFLGNQNIHKKSCELVHEQMRILFELVNQWDKRFTNLNLINNLINKLTET